MQNELPVLQKEIADLTSKNRIMQSRICAKEEQISRNEQLMQHLSSQLRNEEQQMHGADETVRQEIQNFATDVRVAGECDLGEVSQKLMERMGHVQNLYDRSAER